MLVCTVTCRLELRAIFTTPHKCVQHILLLGAKIKKRKSIFHFFFFFFPLLEQSLKEKAVGIAAGLRHALAATGKYVVFVFSFLDQMKSTFNA